MNKTKERAKNKQTIRSDRSLTCKLATHKAVHNYNLCYFYVQTLKLPKKDRETQVRCNNKQHRKKVW